MKELLLIFAVVMICLGTVKLAVAFITNITHKRKGN